MSAFRDIEQWQRSKTNVKNFAGSICLRQGFGVTTAIAITTVDAERECGNQTRKVS
jgi:hypothetical protein